MIMAKRRTEQQPTAADAGEAILPASEESQRDRLGDSQQKDGSIDEVLSSRSTKRKIKRALAEQCPLKRRKATGRQENAVTVTASAEAEFDETRNMTEAEELIWAARCREFPCAGKVGVRWREIKVGQQPGVPKKGRRVSIYYTARLGSSTGEIFDSTDGARKPGASVSTCL